MSAFDDIETESSGDTSDDGVEEERLAEAYQQAADRDDGGDTVTDGAVTDSRAAMVDAFADTLAAQEDDESFTDAAGVRSVVDYEDDDQLSEQRYEDPDSNAAADDVDPRGLFRQPSVNELRYYAREGPYGRAIVHKPINDAFKHGFEIVGDPTESENTDDVAPDPKEEGLIKDFLDANAPTIKTARKKARRDGLALVMYQTTDPADSAADPMPTDDSADFEGLTIWTLDNLTDDITAAKAAEHTEYDRNQLYVTEGNEHGGVVIVDDISHPDHDEVVGYGIEERRDSEREQTAEFVHASRVYPIRKDTWVDGPLGNNVHGGHVGESVITPVLQPLMATQMGFWALKNILFRYSAPLHAVEPPESWSMEDFEDANSKMADLSMASDATLPPGCELSVTEGVSEFDPTPIYETLVEAICAGTVFSKSVLQGTQTGTVSGSETDVKSYFNEVELLRSEELASDMHTIVEDVARFDQSTLPRPAAFGGWRIEWGPLFKPTDIERMEGAVSLITGLSSGVGRYILTPDEARSIVESEWAELDIDVNLDELTEDDMDTFDRINVREVGRDTPEDEPDRRENPRLQNGGGQPQGQSRESSQPTRQSADSRVSDLTDVSEEHLLAELKRREDTQSADESME